MEKTVRQATRRLQRLGRAIFAIAQWFLLSPRSRKSLWAKGILNWRDFKSVWVGLQFDSAESFVVWIEAYGLGLVKDPTDVYELMRVRLDQEPEFAFVPSANEVNAQSQTGVGFQVTKLPSGAWFYSCPFELGSPQASTWLYETSERMGFVPAWRATEC